MAENQLLEPSLTASTDMYLAGSWNWKESQDLKPGTPTQDAGMPSGILTAVLNDYP